MSYAALPDRLRKRLDKSIAQHRRGVITEDEFVDELIGDIRDYLRAKHGSFGRPPAKEFSGLLRDVSLNVEAPIELLAAAYSRATPDDRSVLNPHVAEALERAARVDDLEQVAYLALRYFRATDTLPPDVVTRLRQPPPLSGTANLALAYTSSRGDDEVATAVTESDCERGCTVLLAWRIGHFANHGRKAGSLLDLVDRQRLASDGSWGDITAVAAALVAAGMESEAYEWSSAVDDSDLTPSPELGWLPPVHVRHNGGLDGFFCEADDARLFAPLAVIDLLCGHPARAADRARRFTSGRDPQGWATAVHAVMTEWVSATCEPDPTTRLRMLSEIGYAKHTAYGFIWKQIASDGSRLAAELGVSVEMAAPVDETWMNLEGKAGSAIAGPFAYNHLLRCLPVSRGERDAAANGRLG